MLILVCLVGLLTEHGADLFDRFVLGLRHFLPREPAEESQEAGKDDKHIGTQQFLYREGNRYVSDDTTFE